MLGQIENAFEGDISFNLLLQHSREGGNFSVVPLPHYEVESTDMSELCPTQMQIQEKLDEYFSLDHSVYLRYSRRINCKSVLSYITRFYIIPFKKLDSNRRKRKHTCLERSSSRIIEGKIFQWEFSRTGNSRYTLEDGSGEELI